MGLIDNAVRQGVEAGLENGFQQALAEACDGRYERDRCPVPEDRCACACVEYLALPWWRKVFMRTPPAPSNSECVAAIVWQETGA